MCWVSNCTLRARQVHIDTRSVIFLAAENGALPAGKVGGVGDVVRDLPHALGAAGWDVTVATPSYGTLHTLPGGEYLATIDVGFRGATEAVDIWRIPDPDSHVDHIVIDHPQFASNGVGKIYHRDAPGRPFASDANNFALFCAGAAQWIGTRQTPPDVVHLHDWHAAFYLLLTHYDRRYEHLREIHTVFTVHNLSYQGIRPLAGDESSLTAWFPGMHVNAKEIADARYDDCINPMAAAIRLSDRVSTVSPTYAEEICRPSNAATGFIGGEGLEGDLIKAREEGRLAGVLNGCYYDQALGRRPGWQRLLSMIAAQLRDWAHQQPSNRAHALALERLAHLPRRRPPHVLVSIGRLVEQKAALLLQVLDDDRSALQHIAEWLGRKGVILLLGSGDPELEARMLREAHTIPNLVFLHGYSETLAAPFYRAGDLFLMPSSFEPCGISQMLAMRAGQPCVVHGVGGLRDTVEDGLTGFVFDGHSPVEQARGFVKTTQNALELRSDDPIAWEAIAKRAAAQRFDWALSAQQTIQLLYGGKNE